MVAPVGADDVLVVLPALCLRRRPLQRCGCAARRPPQPTRPPCSARSQQRHRSMALAVAASAPQEPVPAEKPRSAS